MAARAVRTETGTALNLKGLSLEWVLVLILVGGGAGSSGYFLRGGDKVEAATATAESISRREVEERFAALEKQIDLKFEAQAARLERKMAEERERIIFGVTKK